MKRHLFSPDHEDFRRRVAGFLDAEVVPHYQAWESAGLVPKKVWREAGRLGLLCRTVPTSYGGSGGTFIDSIIVIEEIARRRVGGFMAYLQSDIVVPYILQLGSTEQKSRYLADCVAGRTLASVAITEPHSGSDLESIRTVADTGGQGYCLNGIKDHVSGGVNADLFIVAARTGVGTSGRQGLSLFIIDGAAKGLRRIPLAKAGLRALDTATLVLSDVIVSPNDLLGSEGMGFIYLMRLLSIERLTLAAAAQASMTGLLIDIIDDCASRPTRTGTILDIQNVRFVLADLVSECSVNQAFIDQCSIDFINNRLDAVAAGIAKTRATEALRKAAVQAIQFRGARGVDASSGGRAAQDLLDACAQTVWGGSNEVITDAISKGLDKWASTLRP